MFKLKKKKMPSKYNPLYDPKTDNLPIDPKIQKRLNQPLKDPSGFAPKDKKFLEMVLEKIEKGELNLFNPDTLINQKVYQKLSETLQGKVDQNAVILLANLRNIYDLYRVSKTPTFQLQNLILQVRLAKERIEIEKGDVFVI